MRDIDGHSQVRVNYKKQDLVNLFDVICQVKNTDLIQNHNLWDIPKKNHEKDKYENGEMTD